VEGDEVNYSLQMGRDYFAGLRVTKRNKATVLLILMQVSAAFPGGRPPGNTGDLSKQP
jgi:hypothetical protein